MNQRKAASGALMFLTLMGIVSLFSDMTHEGARSVLGDYLIWYCQIKFATLDSVYHVTLPVCPVI